MIRYIAGKTVSFVIVLILISLLTFLACNILPGDPITVMLGTDADPERAAALSEELSLDKPPAVRYLLWISGLFQGNFGTSIKYQLPVAELVRERLPVTAALSFFSLAFALAIAFPAGLLCARFHARLPEKIITAASSICTAVPPFFLSMIVLYVCGIIFHLFHPGKFIPLTQGFVPFMQYLLWPAAAIAVPNSAVLIKYISSSAFSELSSGYIRTARSKGCGETRIVLFHVFRNSALTAVTVIGMMVSNMLSGSIVVEQIFSVPGTGQLLVSAINARDFPLLETLVVFSAGIVVIVNFAVDILYSCIDPRIRIGAAAK